MNISPRNKPILISILFTLCLSSSSAIYGADRVVTPPLTKCSIEVDDPHLSNYLLRTRGLSAVKVNARSRCNKLMQHLVFTVEIYKIGLFVDHLVATNEVVLAGPIYPNKVVKNQKTFVECKNNRRTKYYGIAFASAIIDGRLKKTLNVISERTKLIKCGN